MRVKKEQELEFKFLLFFNTTHIKSIFDFLEFNEYSWQAVVTEFELFMDKEHLGIKLSI